MLNCFVFFTIHIGKCSTEAKYAIPSAMGLISPLTLIHKPIFLLDVQYPPCSSWTRRIELGTDGELTVGPSAGKLRTHSSKTDQFQNDSSTAAIDPSLGATVKDRRLSNQWPLQWSPAVQNTCCCYCCLDHRPVASCERDIVRGWLSMGRSDGSIRSGHRKSVQESSIDWRRWRRP